MYALRDGVEPSSSKPHTLSPLQVISHQLNSKTKTLKSKSKGESRGKANNSCESDIVDSENTSRVLLVSAASVLAAATGAVVVGAVSVGVVADALVLDRLGGHALSAGAVIEDLGILGEADVSAVVKRAT